MSLSAADSFPVRSSFRWPSLSHQRWLSPVALLALWELGSRTGVIPARILAAPGQHIDEYDVREFVAKEAAHHVVSFRDRKAQSRQIGAKWHGGSLAQITAPALVLHGEQDPLLRVTAAHDIAAAVPGSRLRTLPGVGHFLIGDVWATYADELRAFADGADEQPPAAAPTQR